MLAEEVLGEITGSEYFLAFGAWDLPLLGFSVGVSLASHATFVGTGGDVNNGLGWLADHHLCLGYVGVESDASEEVY